MLPSRHVIASFSIGAVFYFFSRSIAASLFCIFSGVLVDLDHFLDYAINSGMKRFTFKEMYWACLNLPHLKEESEIKKVYLLLHAWEIVVILWIVYILTRNIYSLALAIGYTEHLILDTVARAFHPLAYSLIYRFRRGFKPIKFFHSRFR